MTNLKDETVFQLAYLSDSTESFSDEYLRGILDVSRKKNKSCGITGVLLASKGLFFQVLEGEKDDVMALYEVIESDARHSNSKIIFEHTGPRFFGKWSMAYGATDDFHLELRDRVEDYIFGQTKSEYLFNPEEVLELLNLIADENFN